MSTPQVKDEELVRQLATEIRLLEGSVSALQSRLEIVRGAINEVTLAHATLTGLATMQDGDETLVPAGAGSYIRMKLADSKKLVMGVGAGAAIEKDVPKSLEELKGRMDELDQARNSIQQQLDQTLSRYQQDREALEELLRSRSGTQQRAS